MRNTSKTEKRSVGDLGEELASRFLMKQGLRIIERNYLKKWGEIDIISQKGSIIHFIEVKTVRSVVNVSYETNSILTSTDAKALADEQETYRPEDNVHIQKLKRLSRAIQTYLLDRKVSPETDWQIDVVTVRLDTETKKAKIEILENVF